MSAAPLLEVRDLRVEFPTRRGVLTAIAGHYVIKAMRRYLARRQQVERQTESERRQALTPEEALRAATVHGARALGLRDRGTLAAGQRADFCVWSLAHPNELCYWIGGNPCRQVVIAGQSVAIAPATYEARSP